MSLNLNPVHLDQIERREAMVTNNLVTLDQLIDTSGVMFAHVIKQAKEDSMPQERIFRSFRPTSIFSTNAYECSDAALFMSSKLRCGVYAEVAGLDYESSVLSEWSREHRRWSETVGKSIADNVISYMRSISKQETVSKSIFLDLVAYLKSEHAEFWANIAKVDVEELRNELFMNLGYTGKNFRKQKKAA